MWQIHEYSSPPNLKAAVYFLVLPHDGEVVYSDEITTYMTPSRFYGDINGFIASNTGAPLIPLDLHMAMVLGWVDQATMARNMEYLGEKIRAAVALVT